MATAKKCMMAMTTRWQATKRGMAKGKGKGGKSAMARAARAMGTATKKVRSRATRSMPTAKKKAMATVARGMAAVTRVAGNEEGDGEDARGGGMMVAMCQSSMVKKA
jgi:hypothetical protein